MHSAPPLQARMPPIWKVVAMTTCFTVVGGYIWHLMDMGEVGAVYKKQNSAARQDVKLLSAYRDVLRRDGLEKANAYLEKIPNTNYGI